VALAFSLLLAVLTLSGCRGSGGGGPAPDPGHAASPERSGPVVSLEVYGDSLTVADSPSFQDGETGPQSWVHHLGAHGMRMTGGSGRWGATADDIESQHLQQGAPADLLVLFLGTNDLAASGPVEGDGLLGPHQRFVRTLERIVARQGYPPERVVVVAVGPRDGGAAAPVEQWNRLTAQAVADRNWHLVDPWPTLRTADNRFADSTLTTDGLHLDTPGARQLAAGMAAGLRRIAPQGETGGAGEEALEGVGERVEGPAAPDAGRPTRQSGPPTT
jgi:lysophospholipase L1-like esterase